MRLARDMSVETPARPVRMPGPAPLRSAAPPVAMRPRTPGMMGDPIGLMPRQAGGHCSCGGTCPRCSKMSGSET